MEPTNQNLRSLLQEMANGLAIDQHQSELEKIRKITNHRIALHPDNLGYGLDDCNCVMYALNLIGQIKPVYRDIFGSFRANTDFLAHLVEIGELAETPPSTRKIAIWRHESKITHAGIIVGANRAKSKWGSGHVYEHDLLEVPECYGSELRFYGPISRQKIIRLLDDFSPAYP